MGLVPGMTVGTGATEEVAVTVFLRASSISGSTIMVAVGGSVKDWGSGVVERILSEMPVKDTDYGKYWERCKKVGEMSSRQQ